MARAAHKGDLGLLHGGMMGNVLAHCRKGVAKGFQHLGGAAVGGGVVGKVMIVPHILAFFTGQLAQNRIQRQRGQIVGDSVLI